MSTNDLKFIEHWPEQEKKGILRHILLFGLIWGPFTAVVSNLFRLGDGTLAALYLSTDFLLRLFIFTIVGFILAANKWRKSKIRYNRLTKESAWLDTSSHSTI